MSTIWLAPYRNKATTTKRFTKNQWQHTPWLQSWQLPFKRLPSLENDVPMGECKGRDEIHLDEPTWQTKSGPLKVTPGTDRFCRFRFSHRVQALLVGGDDIDPSRGLCIYSIEPSGSWQSWGKGTCIGRYSNKLRKELAKSFSSSSSSSTSLQETLSKLVGCWVETCKSENINLSEEEDIEVLVMHRNSTDGKCKLYVVENEFLDKIFSDLRRSSSSSWWNIPAISPLCQWQLADMQSRSNSKVLG